MKIGGFVKSSLIDYPGKVAAVIFTQGCNFKCPYCHNPELVYPELFIKPFPFKRILDFLKDRTGLLEGVVFCGGEPTLQDDLLHATQTIRSLGYAVKLDTNGSKPDALSEVLPWIDYVAMDIKAPFGPAYTRACGVAVKEDSIRRSMRLIREAGLAYEFRTTVHPDYMPVAEIEHIRKELGWDERYIVQYADKLRGNTKGSEKTVIRNLQNGCILKVSS